MQGIYRKISNNEIGYGAANSVVNLIQQICLYGFIILKVIMKEITVGEFSMYLSAASQFTSTLRSIMYTVVDIRQYSDYFEAFEKFLDMNKNTRNQTKRVEKVDLSSINIEFSNVSYKYAGQSNFALENISIKFCGVDKIGIIGENGSGKSTFVKLLLRIYTPTEGKIYLNGIDIQDIDYDYYCSLFSAVFQDFKLFSMSLKDNIILNKDSFDDEILLKILTECGLQKKIDTLSKGIETFVYKDFSRTGFEPSGGESQKIAIARALYRDTPFIILDEPTAALDPRAEAELYSQFNHFFRKKFVLYISHRLAVTKYCNKILTFKSGKLIEVGSHQELMKMEGIYAELFKLQADYYDK